MHFNVLIKTTHLETFRSVCSSDSDPPGDMLQACFAELPADLHLGPGDGCRGLCMDGEMGGCRLGSGAGRSVPLQAPQPPFPLRQ